MTSDDFNAVLSEAINACQSLAPTIVSIHDALRNLLADARRAQADAERLVRTLRLLQKSDAS